MKTTAAAAAILGTSLMAPFHSFKSLGMAARGGGRLVVLGPAWHCVLKWVLRRDILGHTIQTKVHLFLKQCCAGSSFYETKVLHLMSAEEGFAK